MLPVIPFDILRPLAIFVVLLCISAAVLIVARRAGIKYWTREGERLVSQAEEVLNAVMDGASPDRVTRWLKSGTPARITGLVKAAQNIQARDGGDGSWMDGTGISTRLGEILSRPSGEKRSRRERWVRVAAAGAIGALDLSDGIDALVAAMEDPDAEIAYAAADSLARLNRPETAEAVLAGISSDPTLNNSRLAAMVEGMNCDLTDVFRRQLERDDSAARFWTVTLIGQRELFDLIENIRPLLESEDANVRAAAAECVGELKIPMTDRWLEPLIEDEMWFVQSHAAKSLGELKAAWAIPQLVALLHESEWWLRQNAVDALVKIGRETAEAVERLLHDKDRFARNSAVEILERVGWINLTLLRAARGDPGAESLLKQFGVCGGVEYLENALFTAPEDSLPILLEILRELGDDATYGRIRAAAEQMAERFRPLALTVAAEMKTR